MLLGFGLMCVMGANTIDWGEDQPVANPGDVELTIEAKGKYTLDPDVTFFIDFFYNPLVPHRANAKDGNWDKTVTVAVPANYDCWAELVAVDKDKKVDIKKTSIVKLQVK